MRIITTLFGQQNVLFTVIILDIVVYEHYGRETYLLTEHVYV